MSSAVIPEGVAYIGERAFAGCSALTAFSLPASVKDMPANAFPPNTNLEKLEVAPGNPLYCTEKNILYSEDKSILYKAAAKGVADMLTIPSGVKTIEKEAFAECSSLSMVGIAEGGTEIKDGAFKNCSSLMLITIPSSMKTIASNAFVGVSKNCQYVFLGDVPDGIEHSSLGWSEYVKYPEEYADAWRKALALSRGATGVDSRPNVIVSARMEGAHTMRVSYTVQSCKKVVKTRAVAFVDGVRSFTNILPVKGTGVPNGTAVAANTEHSFTWNVGNGLSGDLAKIAVEILVEEAELLPQKLMTIPGTTKNAKEMVITWNPLSEAQAFNALLWCCADEDEAVKVKDGVVTINGIQVASGMNIDRSNSSVTALLNYLYGKMGYKVLAGADLEYAKAATRLELANSGLGQVSVKVAETATKE